MALKSETVDWTFELGAGTGTFAHKTPDLQSDSLDLGHPGTWNLFCRGNADGSLAFGLRYDGAKVGCFRRVTVSVRLSARDIPKRDAGETSRIRTYTYNNDAPWPQASRGSLEKIAVDEDWGVSKSWGIDRHGHRSYGIRLMWCFEEGSCQPLAEAKASALALRFAGMWCPLPGRHPFC